MTIAQLVQAAIPASITLIVLALGLRCSPAQALSLFRQPMLLRSLLAMNVVLPIVAAVMVAAINLNPAVEIALVALAVSPVPSVLPGKELRLVSDEDDVCGMLVAISLLALVTVPVMLTLLDLYFGRVVRVHPVTVARIVAVSVLAPLALGMALRGMSAGLAARLTPIANALGLLLLVAFALVTLAAGWDAFRSLFGDGTLIACVVVATVGLVVGHVFGGAEPDHQTVLALATACRHPGVAVAIGAAALPGDELVPPAVVLYALVGALVSTPYAMWRRRHRAADAMHRPPSSTTPTPFI